MKLVFTHTKGVFTRIEVTNKVKPGQIYTWISKNYIKHCLFKIRGAANPNEEYMYCVSGFGRVREHNFHLADFATVYNENW